MSDARMTDARPPAQSYNGAATDDYSDVDVNESTLTQEQGTQNGSGSTSASSSGTQFDPKLLLNPKAGSQNLSDPSADNVTTKRQSEKSESPSTNFGSLIERAHGISKRSERPIKRQKVDDDLSEVPPEKKGHFEGGTTGSILGNYIKEKRAQAEDEVVTTLPTRPLTAPVPFEGSKSTKAIDLTGDDDDEVVVVSDNGEREVCLGKLERAYVNAHQCPAQRVGGPHGTRSTWPSIRVTMRRHANAITVIQVLDGQGKHFGTLDPKTSSGLAPVIGSQATKLRIDARVEPRARVAGEGPGVPFSRQLFLLILLFAPRKQAKSIGQYLHKRGLFLRMPPTMEHNIEYFNPQAPNVAASRYVNGGMGARNSSATSGVPQAGYVIRTTEEIRSDVLGMFDKLATTDNLPECEATHQIKTKLLKHQKQALWFMLDRESNQEPDASGDNDKASLWKKRTKANGQVSYYNIITGYEQQSKPEPVRGGILADVMGLGKTLSVLSLVVSSLDQAKAWADRDPENTENPKIKATLLIAPLSTIVNWQDQVEAHLKARSIRWYVYHGANRTQDINALSKYDIVITSYQVAANDFRPSSKCDALFGVNWFRVVLDEAHMIRNQSTAQSHAICALSTSRRWAVTGTPVQNRLDDLGALIKFLRVKPFDEKGGFTQFIMTPFKQADPSILPKLRILVDGITLRRLKDKIDLPSRQSLVVRLDFNDDERALYDFFAADSANKVKAITAHREHGLGGRAYAHVLKAILRLRLVCAHGSELLSEDDMKLTEGMSLGNAIDLGDDEDDEKPVLSPKQAFDMLTMLRGADQDRCEMCRKRIGGDSEEDADDEIEDDTNTIGWMTPCYHLLCPSCFPQFDKEAQEIATSDRYMDCPLCTQYVKVSFFELKRDEVENAEKAQQELRKNHKLAKQLSKYGGPHTKTKELMKCIMEDRTWSEEHASERPIKSVIFSGWTSHLDLIEIALNEHHPPLNYTRLDGSMSRKDRAKALETFRLDPSVPIILITMGAGGLGLNLTTASRVYVMEPQFNPAAEAQAVERVHRLGQEREVIIRRFIMKNSFEEKMLELQRKKEQLADLSMGQGVSKGKAGREEESRRKLEDLRSLFK